MPVFCNEEDIAEVDFDLCNPDVRTSEIKRLFLALPQSAEFVDWSIADAWNDRLSQTSNDVNAIRTITCIGDKPAPVSIRKDISLQRKKITYKTHTLLITIDEVTAANHAFIIALKKGRILRVWYETTGRQMFGGNSGIVAMVYGDMVLARGQGEIAVYELQIIWNKLRTEDRIESPIFDDIQAEDEPLLNEDGTPIENEDTTNLLHE